MGFPELLVVGETSSVDFLALAKVGGDELLQQLLEIAGGVLPPVFLAPGQALQIPSLVFQKSCGYFLTFCSWSETEEELKLPDKSFLPESKTMTANIFLSIAKKVQEATSTSLSLPRFAQGHLIVGPSVTLLLNYWAFSLDPGPSACNNLGILLATTPWSITQYSDSQRPSFAVDMGRAYYKKGMEFDPEHPHLLTNMGSLLKETGDIEGAIQLSVFNTR